MKLLRLRKGAWEVLAVCSDDDNECQVLGFLDSLKGQNHAAERMLMLISQEVPDNGPRWSNPNYVAKLTDTIWEFKRGPKTGKKLRVLWFTDSRHRIVCTNAFEKDTKTTPPIEIQRAERIYQDYHQSYRSKDRYIIDLNSESNDEEPDYER